MDTNITKIYLVENCYGDPNKVYIGKTKNDRLNDHKKIFGYNILYNVIDYVYSLEYKNWEPIETYWIEQFRQWGFEIMNKRMKGGSGPNFHSYETKLKISKAAIGKNTWRKGKPSPNSGGKGIPKPKSGNRKWTQDHLSTFRESARNKNKEFYKNKEWILAQQKQIIQYDLEMNIIKEWDSIKEASNSLSINRVSISHNLSLKSPQKTAGGYIWKYK